MHIPCPLQTLLLSSKTTVMLKATPTIPLLFAMFALLNDCNAQSSLYKTKCTLISAQYFPLFDYGSAKHAI